MIYHVGILCWTFLAERVIQFLMNQMSFQNPSVRNHVRNYNFYHIFCENTKITFWAFFLAKIWSSKKKVKEKKIIKQKMAATLVLTYFLPDNCGPNSLKYNNWQQLEIHSFFVIISLSKRYYIYSQKYHSI